MPRAQSISIAALSLLPFFLIAEDVSERGRGYVGLVYGGKPRAVVVVAENPTRVAQVAAKEFIHFIEKITGQKLSLHVDAMVPRRSRAPRRVLIGESRLTRELGIKSGDFADQEYLIETREKDLILIGRDVQEYGLISYEKNGLWPTAGRRGEGTFFKPMGTLYAVHTFLEKYCGLRWYLPGEIGEVCPKTEKLVVRNIFLQTKPWTRYRWSSRMAHPDPFSFYYGQQDYQPNRVSGRDMRLWQARMKVGGSPYAVNHSMYGYANRFGKSHPEWWADGKPMKGAHLDYLHPGVIQQAAQDAMDFFDGKFPDGKYPDGSRVVAAGDYFAAMPMDASSGWVATDEARKLLKEPKAGAPGVPSAGFFCGWASDYVYTFVNRVARRVAEKHPDKWITCTSYASYFLAPRELAPNVSASVTGMVNSSFSAANKKYFYDNLKRWSELTKELYVWEYYLIQAQNGFRYFPIIYPKRVAGGIRHMQSCGVKGMFWEQSGSPGLVANPAEQMLNRYITWKYLCDTSEPVEKILARFYRGFFGPAEKPMRDFFEKIQSRWHDPNMWREPGGGQQLSWEKLCPPEMIDDIGEPIQRAMKMELAEPYKARVSLMHKAIYEPMKKNCLEYQQRMAFRPKIVCRATKKAPVIDGVIDDDAWKAAAVTPPFVDYKKSKKVSVTTVARILRDDTYLYIAYTCEEPDIKRIVSNITANDNIRIAGDSEVELFLDIGRTGKRYFHILVNADGYHADRSVNMGHGSRGMDWSSKGRFAAKRRTDGYDVEMAIPLKSLGVESVKPGDKWGVNFNRCRGNISSFVKESRFTCWSPTYGGFNRPNEFGVVLMD